ncbi:hypothetical protein ACNOYE_21045 [Nannocystaceae bacterium ST9]
MRASKPVGLGRGRLTRVLREVAGPARSRDAGLRPARALVTWPWLVALAVLIVNDQVLKHAGVLPGVVTGKLSDFAGLLVAPTLFATVLRVRSERGLCWAHLAIGVVFAGIQLSTGFAELWSRAMGLVGYPWTIVSDPGDLVALPMLLVSWTLLRPSMTREWNDLVVLREVGMIAAIGVGLWASVATTVPAPARKIGQAASRSEVESPEVEVELAGDIASVTIHDFPGSCAKPPEFNIDGYPEGGVVKLRPEAVPAPSEACRFSWVIVVKLAMHDELSTVVVLHEDGGVHASADL